MEIVLHQHNPAVVFYSRKEISGLWAPYFPNSARMGNRTTYLALDLHAPEILKESIETWISYLLSMFERKYKPSPTPQPSVISGLRMGATIDNALVSSYTRSGFHLEELPCTPKQVV